MKTEEEKAAKKTRSEKRHLRKQAMWKIQCKQLEAKKRV